MNGAQLAVDMTVEGQARTLPHDGRRLGLPDRAGGADQHAQACAGVRAQVHLRYWPEELEVEILDNGRGARNGRPTATAGSG